MSFREWFDAGFRDIIPVVPPGAEFSPLSKMEKSQAGKSPGRRNAHGLWTGLKDWTDVKTTEALCDEWGSWGANIGLRTRHFPAIDIDCMDESLAAEVALIARHTLGPAPVRIGRAPKRTLLYKTVVPFRRQRLWIQKGAESHLVEVLGDGQQFVVEGLHPGTGKAFTWDSAFDPSDLSGVTADNASRFLESVTTFVTKRGFECRREGAARSGPAPDQSHLRGDPDEVVAAVFALPNTTALFPTREDYLKVGYAIKAALNDGPGAFDFWWEWCCKWEGNDKGGNDLERARADWDRMVPPYAVGASWLYELARDYGYHDAQQEFNDAALLARAPEPDRAPDPSPPERVRAVDTTERSGAIAFSDAWLAHRFLAAHGGQIRYCDKLGGWMQWDGHRWAADPVGAVAHRMGQVLKEAGRTAITVIEQPTEARTTAKICASERCRSNVLRYAAVDPVIAVAVEDFDTNLWALNTPAGIVDLKTGVLGPADPARLFTRCTAVAPAAMPTPLWDQFLSEATHDDPDLARYLQRLAGYACTGSTREHILAFLWGPGGNGKGVFLNTLVRLAGSYASVAAMDTFTSSRFDRHPTELADLFGARLVTAQETQEGRSWDEAKVKSITGGDPIKARFMRQDFFTYLPQFTLVFAGNHKPRIHNLDDAMRRRFHLVPFTVTPKRVDVDLQDKLVAEWPGILQWALEGCLAWQAGGLQPPKAVLEATAEYFADEDPIGRWLDERTGEGPGTETRDCWADFQIWCNEQNEKPGTQRSFIQALLSRGLPKWRHPTTRRHGIGGLVLRPDHEFRTTDADLEEALAPRG